MICHDVIVIGAGLAGIRAAIEASHLVDVGTFSKVYVTRSHSGAAQGGINAVLNPKDSIESHIFDTIKGGDYLGDQDAIEMLCQAAPQDIYELEHWGMNFSRNGDGRINQRFLAGASFERCCYGADLTGHRLLHLLYEQLLKSNVKIYNEWYITSFIVEEERCCGAVGLNILEGRIEMIKAKAVIVATGGYGRLFSRTTNAYTNTGDGIAMVFNVGIPLADMEFVQFHPTTLFRTNILISEAARGEGGQLRNKGGERFMQCYAPDKLELAPRDIIARSIQKEIREGRGIMDEYVHLDVSHLGPKKVNERIPQIKDLALRYAGVDVTKEPIPIQPAQHYSMGGIRANIWGETLIKGLFAVGECSCISVHGANRLGGNSLMETIVFGRRIGNRASEYALSQNFNTFSQNYLRDEELKLQAFMNQKGRERYGDLRNELCFTMTEKLGIFRDAKGIEEGLNKIRELKKRYNHIQLHDKGSVFNTELHSVLQLGNLLELAEIIALGALRREESRGSHFREDFTKRDDQNWLKHTLAIKTEEGFRLEYEDVNITKFRPEIRKY